MRSIPRPSGQMKKKQMEIVLDLDEEVIRGFKLNEPGGDDRINNLLKAAVENVGRN